LNKTSWLVLNFSCFVLLVLISASIQSSLFHWVLGWRPTIQLSLVFLVYVCLTRPPIEGFIFVVVTCYCIGLLSVMLTSLNVFNGLCLFVLIQMLRTRVYSPGPVYFTWTALAAVFGFHLIAWLTSLFEVRPVAPRPLDWLLEVLLTSLFVRLVYTFSLWIDKKTKRLSLSELNS